jgi:uncharacterized radical SAM protein YgiQ
MYLRLHFKREGTLVRASAGCYNPVMHQPLFLPMTRAELDLLGWDAVDVLLVTGDAYVDHPSFGAALIGRWLGDQGLRVGIIAQPDWRDPQSVAALGRPGLFAGITAGAMDSMVSNYTANKKLRRDDAYAPGGHYGLRPNRASVVYANLVKHAFPGLPIVLGGIEASLRRLAHYDYWDDHLRRSLLLDAKADILVYGMGERQVLEIARRLERNEALAGIAGTAVPCAQPPTDQPIRRLPSWEEIAADPKRLLRATLLSEAEQDWRAGRTLAQAHGDRWVVVFPPARPLATAELDALYALPFTRRSHPAYSEPIPALEPVLNSIVTHRGCFGGCTFCGLGAHQGKIIQSRSLESILAEARSFALRPTFHGTITDLGGPTANMYGLTCRRPAGECRRASCLFPTLCRQLETSHRAQLEALAKVRALPHVRHVFVASGIRYDLALVDPDYLSGLVAGGYVSGALKVAPEHTEPEILARMRKPRVEQFWEFVRRFREESRKAGQPGLLTAYFISAFPGSQQRDMLRLAAQAREQQLRMEQMQDFIPLPQTLAGAMYFSGVDYRTGRSLTIARELPERQAQRRALVGRAVRRPLARKEKQASPKK